MALSLKAVIVIFFKFQNQLGKFCLKGITHIVKSDNWFIQPHILFVVMANHIDVIMGAIASQITSLTIVYSTIYSGADQNKHLSSASLAFVRGIHRWPQIFTSLYHLLVLAYIGNTQTVYLP